MDNWISQLRYDPISPMINSGKEALCYMVRKDLLGIVRSSMEAVWNLPEVQRIVKRQKSDGSWGNSKKSHGPSYNLTETWKTLRYLVDQYQMTRYHPVLGKASDYIFNCQTGEGDIRGILGNQYAPYYTGAILYLLIKAGFKDDPRIIRGIEWLLDMRQNDGGWVIGSPGLVNKNWKDIYKYTSEIDLAPANDFDWSKPFSAAGTGMVLRAFSAHPKFRNAPETIKAARLLKSKFFKKDNWSSYQHPDNWIRFQFPFWWTNIISALDTLSLIDISSEDRDITRGLNWLIDNQQKDGLWKISYSRIHKASNNHKSEEMRYWITYSICRIFKRYYETN